MEELNTDEKKTKDLIKKLRFALEADDQEVLDSLEIEHNKINFIAMRTSLLNELNELYNHNNYGRGE